MKDSSGFKLFVIFVVVPIVFMILSLYNSAIACPATLVIAAVAGAWFLFARSRNSKGQQQLKQNDLLPIQRQGLSSSESQGVTKRETRPKKAVSKSPRLVKKEIRRLEKRYDMDLDWAQKIASGGSSLEAYFEFKAQELVQIHQIPISVAREIASGKTTYEKFRRQCAGDLSQKYEIELDLAFKLFDRKVSLEQILGKKASNLAEELGVSIELASDYVNGKIEPERLFPFGMPLVQSPQSHFNIAELMAEPAGYIGGSTVTVWAYRDALTTKRVVVAGHANGPVCRQVSSLINATFLNSKGTDQDLVVPGAGVLTSESVNSDTLARLIELKPAESIDLEIIARQIAGQRSLDDLANDLSQIQSDSGLVHVIHLDDSDYVALCETVNHCITTFRETRDSTMFSRNVETGQTEVNAFLPFYTLNTAKSEPLVFELDIQFFDCKEFRYLKDYHSRSLLYEMTGDARRRKRIYEEWLHRDEKNFNNLKYLIKQMSPEDQERESIAISGTRNYEEARETRDAQERYISPRKNLEENLPALLNLDKAYLRRMDNLITDFERKDDDWTRRNEHLNLATLIDSFLRGWPSVFLEGEDAQRAYARWCDLRRKAVWMLIHQMLRRRHLRIDPILEENTVFQVTVHGNLLTIKPLHLVSNQKFMLFLSRQFGLTYYVDLWSRRKKILATEQSRDHARESNRKASEFRVDAGLAAIKLGNVEQAKSHFENALIMHPIFASERIFFEWWKRFSKNTQRDFERFRPFVQGIVSFNRQENVTSIQNLTAFTENYPGFLPDPYILLSFQNQLVGRNLQEKQQRLQELVLEYNRLVTERQAKVDFLRSNHAIEESEKGFRLSPKFDVRKNLAVDSDGKYLSFSNLASLEMYSNILRVWDELGKIAEQQLQVNHQLSTLRSRIEDEFENLWKSLKDSPDTDMLEARRLDSAYVDKVVSEKKIRFSDMYHHKFRPLLDLFQADEYSNLARQIFTLSLDLKSTNLSLSALKKRLAQLLKTELLDLDNLEMLTDLQKTVVSFSVMDSITRELVFRSTMVQITQEYLKQALQQYADAEWRVPEFIDPFKRSVAAYPEYRTQYQIALDKMLAAKVTLRNFSPNGIYEVLDHGIYSIIELYIDKETQEIRIRDAENKEHRLLRFLGLSDEEADHLSREIRKIDLLQRLPLSFGVNSAEQVLNVSISPSLASQQLSQSIQELSNWLIKILAYSFISPVPDLFPPSDEVMKAFDQVPVIESVEVNVPAIQEQFLEQVDPEHKAVTLQM